ncbi:acetylserotonin O-methyltransferase [Streptomyces cucumeris]|uniref:acetylserotonin O-methyltransferase n=1 Tax=Streptomyces cucumeris TaxID=2962890 RepID=UPI0020C8625E|nr:acetylserotonin O-methyltransferase [Streptomyces sp. NEAU-Y11]MCP9212079.1 acetylserotonin O-methyltransferase [Streptomyces sp. NEAU-Y11]
MSLPPTPAQPQDYERMMAMVTGFWVTQTVRAAALYRLADHLAQGTDTPGAIAEAEGIDLDAARRLMRTCASLGLMTSRDGGAHYSGTSLLSTLRKEDPNSLRGFAISQAAPGHWLPWGRFAEAIRTGDHQATAAHGDTTIFDYFARQPEEAALFTESMGNLSRAAAQDIAAVVDTSEVGLALDLGGANGEVVRAMMKANPGLRGGVFDLPHIVPDATAAAQADGLSERFTAIGGDFFEEVPPADLYVLKYVLHDWDDEDCVRILKNCRTALRDGGRIVVVDYLIPEVGTPGIAPLMDLNMLAMTGGRERETAEFDALFAAAGLRRTAITPAGGFAVIEATPA